jgi:23S rRNA (cytidine1920-2'-O)/16S rRNA (cytidine1409-2'-O)-methyltransferase
LIREIILKERIDVLLVEKGLFRSRERARASIMAGSVFVDGQRVDKAGTKIDTEAKIDVKEDDCPYVSRGGFKLKKAIDTFGIDVSGCVCADIGASTGGFTDVMLQHGASKVYSIDVGYGQLDWKLRNDPRVVNMERCNFRYLDTSLIKDDIDFASIDVSFISLEMIFPVLKKILRDGGRVASLVKPQFEAGKEEAAKGKGVIRDPEVQARALLKAAAAAKENGFSLLGVTFSPVKGAKGNIEYLIYLEKNGGGDGLSDEETEQKVRDVVTQSHQTLD